MAGGRYSLPSLCGFVTFFVSVAVIVIFYGYKTQDYTVIPISGPEVIRKRIGKTSTPLQSSSPIYIDIYKSLWQISNNIKNYWLYFRDIVKKTELFNETKTVDDGYVALNSRLMDIVQLHSVERKHKLAQMSQFIQRKIERVQHPENCQKARILLCDISNRCGFGCNLHSLVNCLLQAFVSRRTLVYRSKGWQYADEGWTYTFLPLSNCTDNSDLNSVPNISDADDSQVVGLNDRTEQWINWSVPTELESSLERLHGHPYAWWLSQFVTYAVRLQPWVEKAFDEVAGEINFTSSVVGIQVRWADKIRKQAEKHDVLEYMNFVERWYEQMEHRGHQVNRTVYLATETSSVLVELKAKYPGYKFIGNRLITSKFRQRSRYESGGLESVVADIYFLSKCDYLVCTLSSSVCRTSYELLMNRHADASLRFQSIDTGYRLKRNFQLPMIATMNHNKTSADELEIRKGDSILVTLDPYIPTNDGFLRGKNKRTNREGRFPSFKAIEQIFSYNVSELYNISKLWA